MLKVLINIETDNRSFKSNSSLEIQKITSELSFMMSEIIKTDAVCISQDIDDEDGNKLGTITITQPWNQ